MVEYVQWKFAEPTFAKDLNKLSKKGEMLDGWELICVHPDLTSVKESNLYFYIATFRRNLHGK